MIFLKFLLIFSLCYRGVFSRMQKKKMYDVSAPNLLPTNNDFQLKITSQTCESISHAKSRLNPETYKAC